MMDILVAKTLNNGSQTNTMISAIYNNLGKEAFYLKSRVVSDPLLGTTAASASFRAVLTSLEDEKFMVASG